MSVSTTVEPALEQDLLLGSLLDSCARGNASALEALYDQTAGTALRVARCVAGDEDRAHQAVHDAYIELWHRAQAGRVPDRNLALWILALAHRHAAAA